MTNKKEIKGPSIAKNSQLKQTDLSCLQLVEKKLVFFTDIVQRTIIHVQKNKTLDILGVGDVGACIDRLTELNKKITELNNSYNDMNTEVIITHLQVINNELSSIFKSYGTDSFDDLLVICFGYNNTFAMSNIEETKFELLKKYFHPTSYKVVNKKEEGSSKKNTDETKIDEKTKSLDCFDVLSNFKQFHMKVNGLKVFINNKAMNKSLVVFGVVDDIIMDFLNNKYITAKKKCIYENMPKGNEFSNETFKNFMDSLNLKDYFILNSHIDFFSKYAGYISQLNAIKQKTISQTVKEFILDDLYSKRITIIQLLIKPNMFDNQYLAYLLYDLLSNDANGTVDTQEQTILYDSFPWTVKQHFKNAMKKTIQYTNELSNFELNKMPLEQQICLLKADDSVKEKAMVKLKEIKAKSEDSGSKARQYLDGLLKIPFGVYKREPILNLMNNIRDSFALMHQKYNIATVMPEIPTKDKYTSIEMIKYLNQIRDKFCASQFDATKIANLKKRIVDCDKKLLISKIIQMNAIVSNKQLDNFKIIYAYKKKQVLAKEIELFIDNCATSQPELLPSIDKIFAEASNNSPKNKSVIELDITNISNSLNEIKDYMGVIKTTMDKAVHGHDKAKKQIERIIGQWINGKQDGYCFGFDGPPGVGKTSLAKRGLSHCLKDEKGECRPFAMIQMGGDSNGSTLHGHNYTYVGSTWGSILQILIDKKCMNPIIFIDEVDKISRTEHGKEIVGILTHLLDPTQNECFQDKYFTGIDLDLSKALFILSYNDVEAIDKILLDRVHRIKFSNLSLEDKLVIVNTHILPEVYTKMGLEGMIYFPDDVSTFIIEEYTSESGVRKLKEILFEIVGEINLDVLKNDNCHKDFPVNITISDIKSKYFKDKHEIKYKKIHSKPTIGVINGLWANALGKGGVIPIQTKWRPSDKFLQLHLTGLQGDVMKESMNVSLTLAWNLTPIERQNAILEEQHTQHNCFNGVHVHCPEGSVPKDGPSAGTAITTTLFSLFNEKQIKHNIAITGEMSLDGCVTEIGGLDLKFLGGIKAGVKEFIYPKENEKDYKSFMDKYGKSDIIKDIRFYPVSTIKEVFELVFVD